MNDTNVSFVETIHNLIYDKFDSLKIGGKPQSHEWTVVSSLILQENNSYRVIAITTGTKCVGESSLSQDGFVVNDCHAEVLCRRAFIKFLLNELEQCIHHEKSIFEWNQDTNLYKVKQSIQFHLYISQSPCGIGSVYQQENSKRQAMEISNFKQRASKRRKGIEEIEVDSPDDNLHLSGAKYKENDEYHLSTKPGRGDPSRSYSCSDKICLWNSIGWQGGCLATLIEPVFVSSIIIGGEWEEERMKNALITRISEKSNVQLYHDLLDCKYSEKMVIQHLPKDHKLSACGSSLIWITPNAHEILIPNKGIRLGTNYKKGITVKNTSIICPKRLFQSFHSICMRITNKKSLCDCVTYWSVKELAKDYQDKKQQLANSFMKQWKRKDKVYYSFTFSFVYLTNIFILH